MRDVCLAYLPLLLEGLFVGFERRPVNKHPWRQRKCEDDVVPLCRSAPGGDGYILFAFEYVFYLEAAVDSGTVLLQRLLVK